MSVLYLLLVIILAVVLLRMLGLL